MKKTVWVLLCGIGIFTIIWGGCSTSLGGTYTAPMNYTPPIKEGDDGSAFDSFSVSGTLDVFLSDIDLLELTMDLYLPEFYPAIGAYLKYPFDLGPLKLYPMVGVDTLLGPSAGVGLDIPFAIGFFFRVETVAGFGGIQNNFGDINLTARATLGFNLKETIDPPSLPDPLIPLGTTIIKDKAFSNKLGGRRFVVIPYGVQRIGNKAFYWNDLEAVVIPDTVTEIGKEAFAVNKLKKVFIPDSVKTIGKDAFSSSVTLIRDSELPGEYIGNYKVDIKNGAATITRHKGHEEVVVIPAEINGIPVTAIGKYAFFQKMLAGVTIPDTVTTIGDFAFADNNLKSLTLPDNVRISGKSSFLDAFNRDVASIPGVTTITTVVDQSGYRNNAFKYKDHITCYIADERERDGTIRFIPLNERETFPVNFNLTLYQDNNSYVTFNGNSFNMAMNPVKGHNYELRMAFNGYWGYLDINFILTDLTTRQTVFKKDYRVEGTWGGYRLVEK